jgi:hypothetical protein
MDGAEGGLQIGRLRPIYISRHCERQRSNPALLLWLWIASAYAQKRFGGLQARHSSRSERRRVVALLLAMTEINTAW